MGLDLALVIDRYNLKGSILGFNRISFERDYDLFQQIDETHRRPGEPVCKPIRLVEGIDSYEDEGLKKRTTDPYGEPVTWLPAGELAQIKDPPDICDWNKAVMALVRSLPPDTRIVLWWQ